MLKFDFEQFENDVVVAAGKKSGSIPDSGNRTELVKDGGLRDVQPGNGRCDLMPLDILGDLIDIASFKIAPDIIETYVNCDTPFVISHIFQRINDYIYRGTTESLKEAVIMFMLHNYSIETATEDNVRNVAATAISTAILDLSKRYREGAEKYAERNWEKGIPVKSCLDSGIRHLLKWHRGDSDENHASAFMWNIICAIWMMKNKPNCFEDMPFIKSDK